MRVFLAEASDANIAYRLDQSEFCAVALEPSSKKICGFIEMRSPTMLSMMFVDPSYFRQGIARSLWDETLQYLTHNYPDLDMVQLNSTPYAKRAYQKLGFWPVSREFSINGATVTRMACWLPGLKY